MLPSTLLDGALLPQMLLGDIIIFNVCPTYKFKAKVEYLGFTTFLSNRKARKRVTAWTKPAGASNAELVRPEISNFSRETAAQNNPYEGPTVESRIACL